jgi:hypothetical protein
MLLSPSDVGGTAQPFIPALLAQDCEEVFDLLKKGVRQYHSHTIQFQAAAIATKDLLVMSPYARAYKYLQVERLFDAYRTNNYQPFTARAVSLRSIGKTIVTPPVVEVRPEGHVVIEGTTRAAYCFRNNIDKYHCIEVSGVADDLPGSPVPIQMVTTSERSLSQLERTKDYRGALYRQIERAVHPY